MSRKLTAYRRKYLVLAVSDARRRLKERAIAYKGGRCEQCGYEGNPAAFDFHHRDPAEKDFRISNGHYKSFECIQKELDKTILLCANCHRIVHSELNQISTQALREELARTAPPRGRPRKGC